VRYLALFKGKGQGEGSFFSRVAHKVSLYLLATDALQFPPAGDIALEKVDVGETTSQAAEQGGVDAIPGLGEVVHGPFAALADVDESRAAQVGEVTGNPWLRHAEDRLELADAMVALRQQVQDAEAGLVGEGFEELVGSIHSFLASGKKQADAMLDLAADTSKDAAFLVVGARRVGGIIETPMQLVGGAREGRAGVAGVVAHGDDTIEWFARRFLQRLRVVPGDVDADFPHGVDGQRMHIAGGLGPGAEDIEVVATQFSEPTLGHLTPAGIAGA